MPYVRVTSSALTLSMRVLFGGGGFCQGLKATFKRVEGGLDLSVEWNFSNSAVRETDFHILRRVSMCIVEFGKEEERTLRLRGRLCSPPW